MTGQQLRNSILQLAIQGKLVAQDPKDEPASALLKRIAEERAALPGKRKSGPPSRIERRTDGTFEVFPDGSEKDISDEIPFDIPERWEWSRFGEICINRDSERVPLSMTQRSKQAKIFDYYGASGVIDKVEKFIFEGRFLLIGEDGANLINRSTDIAFFAEGQFWVNNHAHVLSAYREMPLDFICSYINGISLTSFVSGTAQPKLTQAKLNSILVPIPPLEEQQRIVAKIESLLPLVERYGRKQERLLQLNEALPKRLRQSLLQAAIAGKLVAQDPKEEPASALLERIAKERAALPGKRKAAPSSRIERRPNGIFELFPDGSEKNISDEIPFDIPESWEWVRIQTIVEVERGGSPRPIKSFITHDDSGINWIKIGDSDRDSKYILSTREKIKPEGERKSRRVYPGDLLLSNSMSYGRPYILKIDGCIHDGWLVLHPRINTFSVDYLYHALTSAVLTSQFKELAKGSTVSNLNKERVGSALLPLPPLQEQQRIVQQLEELLPLVSQA